MIEKYKKSADYNIAIKLKIYILKDRDIKRG